LDYGVELVKDLRKGIFLDAKVRVGRRVRIAVRVLEVRI